MQLNLIFFTTIVLLFFASNSLLVKYALLYEYADAYSFTLLRLFFGAIMLIFLVYLKEKTVKISFKGNYLKAIMLFLYAIYFSYAYLSLDAGFGALILYAFIQITIILYSITKKEKIDLQKIIGVSIAFLGLVYLLYPSKDFEVSFLHVLFMSISGIAWGAYTIMGKSSINPIANNMDNFAKATLLCLFSFIAFLPTIHISFEGVLLAIISGAITSALGYALWYKVLPQLQTITSGVVQLLVPPIVIFISVLFLGEILTFKLMISTCVILIGILIAIVSKKAN